MWAKENTLEGRGACPNKFPTTGALLSHFIVAIFRPLRFYKQLLFDFMLSTSEFQTTKQKTNAWDGFLSWGEETSPRLWFPIELLIPLEKYSCQ